MKDSLFLIQSTRNPHDKTSCIAIDPSSVTLLRAPIKKKAMK